MATTKTEAFKGFSAGYDCRGFKYEIGKTYEHDGSVALCNSGFHACPYPLDVLRYYAPGTSVFAKVEQSGTVKKEEDGDKQVSSRITIKAALSLQGLIEAAVEYTFKRADKIKGQHSTGSRGAASSTGYGGKVMGAEGNALFLVERDGDWKIVAVWAGIAGRDGIKPNVWYTLQNGKPVEAE